MPSATNRPLIAVSCSHSTGPRGAQITSCYDSYLNAIEAAGGIPLLIYLTNDEAIVRQMYALCQGVLLPGGDDVDPAHYGEANHPALGDVDPARDRVEIWLSQWARADQKPLLGICRGIQVINVAFGGSLYQDIPSQVEGSLDHRESTLRDNSRHLAHPITIAPDSWLAGRIDADELMVNTMHHQAVKDVAPGLRVTAWGPDGIIEAVEGTDHPFVVGIQCHPERLYDTVDSRWQRLFTGFVEACQTY